MHCLGIRLTPKCGTPEAESASMDEVSSIGGGGGGAGSLQRVHYADQFLPDR